MNNKQIINGIFLLLFTFCLIGCGKRNFFEDTNDPGLSRFTSRGYNIATNYINDTAYINSENFSLFRGFYNSIAEIKKIHTSSSNDSLNILWPIVVNDTNSLYSPAFTLSFLLPVSKTFALADFIQWNGKRFPDSNISVTVRVEKFDNLSPGG